MSSHLSLAVPYYIKDKGMFKKIVGATKTKLVYGGKLSWILLVKEMVYPIAKSKACIYQSLRNFETI